MIIGLDVGGTNIDIVLISKKQVVKSLKYLIEDNLEESIKKSLKLFLSDVDKSKLKQINLSTTITTNLIYSNHYKEIGLLLEVGPGLSNDFYKIGKHTKFLSGYTDHQGIIVKKYLDEELKEHINYFKNNNIEDIAICTKFSNRNFKTEQILKEELLKYFKNVYVSHELSSSLNFKRRINTTYLNTLVAEEFKLFLKSVKDELNKLNINVPIYILKADGGTMEYKEALKKPVESILSGPAASLQGINAFYNIYEDSILMDIGGTTTDIFIYSKDNYLFEPNGAKINNFNTHVKAVYTKSFSLGGDSTIIIENKMIKILPERLDKPYALGGKYLTLTDCFVYLEELDFGNRERVNKVISNYANILNVSSEELANLVIEEFLTNLEVFINDTLIDVNNKIVYTIKELLEDVKIIPINIYGIGPTFNILSERIKKKFNLNTYYPSNSNVANAIGSALSKVTKELTMYIDTSDKKNIIPEYNIDQQFDFDINIKEAEKLAKKYLIELNEELKINENDIKVIESEYFNKINYHRKSGVRINLKVSLLPNLIYKMGDHND